MFEEYFAKYDSLDVPDIKPVSITTLKEDLELENDDAFEFPDLDFSEWEKAHSDLFNYEDYSDLDSSIDSDFTPTWSQEVTPSSSIVDVILTRARSQLGGRYKWAGNNPKTGMDCSGFIQWAFKESGINIPRTTEAMLKAGKNVDLDDILPGDIIITTGGGRSKRHARLVSSIDSSGIHTIEARGSKDGIINSDFTEFNKIISIRRFWDTTPTYVPTPLTYTLYFANKKDYVKKMTPLFKKELEKHGIDGDIWAPILVAHTALESGWGLSDLNKKANNFGGIKGKGVTYMSDEGSGATRTKVKSSFKKYPTPEAFVADYVTKLKNRFHVFDYSPLQFVQTLKNNKYFTDSLYAYLGKFNSALRNVNQA